MPKGTGHSEYMFYLTQDLKKFRSAIFLRNDMNIQLLDKKSNTRKIWENSTQIPTKWARETIEGRLGCPQRWSAPEALISLFYLAPEAPHTAKLD